MSKKRTIKQYKKNKHKRIKILKSGKKKTFNSRKVKSLKVRRKPVKPTRPVKRKHAIPVKRKPIKPVRRKPVKPIKRKPVKPIKRKPVKLIKRKPVKRKRVKKKSRKPVKYFDLKNKNPLTINELFYGGYRYNEALENKTEFDGFDINSIEFFEKSEILIVYFYIVFEITLTYSDFENNQNKTTFYNTYILLYDKNSVFSKDFLNVVNKDIDKLKKEVSEKFEQFENDEENNEDNEKLFSKPYEKFKIECQYVIDVSVELHKILLRFDDRNIMKRTDDRGFDYAVFFPFKFYKK